MGEMSHRVERSKLEAGDHIYSWRTAFAYSHHGIYIGEDRVVHFTETRNWCSCDNSGSTTCFSSLDSPIFCGFRKGQTGVTLSCLNCFLGKGSLYRYQYGVSKCSIIAKRGGTCTTAKSDDPEAVIHRAMYLLYNGFGKYMLFRHNCEDFTLYCKTGLLVSCDLNGVGGSGQSSSAYSIPGAAFCSLPFGIFVSNPVVLGTVAAVTCAKYRYSKDIGVRKDAEKVEAKDVAAFLRQRSLL